QEVRSEWLYCVPTTKEARLFERTDGQIALSTGFREGKDLTEKTRSNALFLSVVAQFIGPLAEKILLWFRDIRVNFGIRDVAGQHYTTRLLHDDQYTGRIVEFMKKLDLGIIDIQVRGTTYAEPIAEEVRTLAGQRNQLALFD